MGRYYAQADNEPEHVAAAIGEFYQPRFAGDAIPPSNLGRCLSLADKLDTMVGIFGVGSPPTGDRDPYALRRAALGVIRILVESESQLDLAALTDDAQQRFQSVSLLEDTTEQVVSYIIERMRGYLVDRGITPDVCAAVFATGCTAPWEIVRRADAVAEFRKLAAAEALSAAHKRISNILRKADAQTPEIEADALSDAAEKALFDALQRCTSACQTALGANDYQSYLSLLAELRDPVDQFFDTVMVMSEDPRERRNRLALLTQLHELFSHVADLALLQ